MTVDEMPTVAEMVEWLFQNIKAPDGESFTNADVEAFVRARSGSLTASALVKIRSGETQNPGYATLRYIATFFGVPATYFMESERTPDYLESILEYAALSQEIPRAIALRASRLPPDLQQELLDYIGLLERRSRR